MNLTSQVVSDYSVSHCLVTKSRPSLGSLNGFGRVCADFVLRDVLAIGKIHGALEVDNGLSHSSYLSLLGFLSPLSDYIIPQTERFVNGFWEVFIRQNTQSFAQKIYWICAFCRS